VVLDTGQRWCPDEQRTFLSSIFFFYINSLMKIGSTKHLELNDLWDVPEQNKATPLFMKFNDVMAKTANPEKYPYVRRYHAYAYGACRFA
jgi:RNAse (barnase) inhibitor barstar